MPEITTEHELNAYYAIEYPAEMRLLIVGLNKLRGKEKDPQDKILAAITRYVGLTPADLSELDRYEALQAEFPQTEGLAYTRTIKESQPLTIPQVISISMLGILRIHHDHVNQSLWPAIDHKGIDVIELTNRIAERVKVDTVPRIGIDGNENSWPSELARDNARTNIKLARPEAARKELEGAVKKLEAQNGNTSIGDVSIWSLLKYELGVLDEDLPEMTQGLKIQRDLQDRRSDKERLNYLSKKVGLAVFNPHLKGSFKDRLHASSQVFQGLLRASL